MNEYEIRRALAGAAPAAAPIPAAPDPDRLRAALVASDRRRTVRSALAVGAVSIVASLGIFMSQAGESAAPTDVVGTPDAPPPQPGVPLVDVGAIETTTTSAAPDTPTDAPAHLDASTPTTSPPAVITVTLPPTTQPPTTAPPTTQPPTTQPPTTQPPTTQPPTTQPPVTTTTAGSIAFHASARYGSCEEPIPYDEYSGTAAPGTTVTVTSPWSTSATTTADAKGDWWIRVEFPTAPVGDTFTVNVTDGTSSADLDFTRTA